MISMSANAIRALRNGLWVALLLAFTSGSRADVVQDSVPASMSAKASVSEDWFPLSDTIFEQFDHEHGLASRVIIAIAEDGDGFLWFGTEGGLARWDGYHFRNYYSNLNDPGSLPVSRIQTLFKDRAGRLWIGTQSGGLVRYDAAQERFIRIPVGPNSISHVHVSAIADDGKGGIWVGTDNGLDHFDPQSGAVTHLRSEPHNRHSLPDNVIQALEYAVDGTLWVGTAKGLVKVDPEAMSVEEVGVPTPDESAPSIASLHIASDGRIWVGTAKFGAFVIDPVKNSIRSIRQKDGAAHGTVGEWVRSIAEIRPGLIWLGTDGHGIVEFDVGSATFRNLRHDPNVAASLADNTVWDIKLDRAGLVLVGTQRGVSRFDASHDMIRTVTGGSGKSQVISDADVESVLSAKDGRLWLGLRKNGIDILDIAGRQVQTIRPDPARPGAALPQSTINALAQIEDGHVLIGTNDGLYEANSGATTMSRLEFGGRDRDLRVDTLLADGKRLWLGSVVDGLWQLDVSAKVSAVRPAWVSKLSDQRINDIISGKSGGLWIGTDYGLNYVRPDEGTVLQFLPVIGITDTLTSGEISSLMISRNGHLWIGTFGGGINVIENPEQQGGKAFRHISTADGLPSANIDQMLEDRAGRIWVSTDSGLAVIEPETYKVRALQRADGVPISDYWSNAGAMTRKGDLVFGGLGGITVVRPQRLQTWDYSPPVVITDVRIGGSPVPASRFKEGGDVKTPLTIAPDLNSISVEFSALDFSEPEQNRYAYRLVGFERDWTYTDSNRRIAAYTNLPPGDYQLKLKGTNRAGRWADQELSVPIRVLPSWYQTYWFRSLEFLFGLVFIYGLIWYRTKRLRRQKHQLEAIVLERTKALAIANMELERLAHNDPLTGLGNRRCFFKIVGDHLASARRHHRPCCVLMVDLDHFKQINDRFGHGAGDVTLVASARCLVSCVREIDVTARFGGEEFAVFLPETDISDAREVAERFRRSLEALDIEFEGQIIRVTASIGLSAWHEDEIAIESALDRADIALYRVKASGRNAIAVA